LQEFITEYQIVKPTSCTIHSNYIAIKRLNIKPGSLSKYLMTAIKARKPDLYIRYLPMDIGQISR